MWLNSKYNSDLASGCHPCERLVPELGYKKVTSVTDHQAFCTVSKGRVTILTV